ncbi:MAG: glutaredoxin family protein [Deltaproteobacteria bacterium]|nr:glutaredoxin family protein [Deltaproteobacteria bacterium]
MERPTMIIALSLALATAACSETAPPGSNAPVTAEPAPLVVDAARADLVFRYLDASGAIATASKVDDIPAASRRTVVVWDPASPAPAGWDHVADLSGGLPATATAKKDFTFPTPAHVPAQPTADNKSGHEVVMFTTQGCGYCAKARKFLKAKKVPYTEHDVEADRGAAAKLTALGKKAGLSAGDMQGVPIIFIDGRPILGWDEAQVARLLGLKG